MVNCSIRWCGNTSDKLNYKKHGITFHRFPRCPQTKEKWIKACRRDNWLPTKHSVVCSRHFTEDCFVKAKGSRLLLLSPSVPTLMLPILESPQIRDEAKPPEPQALDAYHKPKQDDQDNKVVIHLKEMIKRKDVLIKRLQSQNSYMMKKIKEFKLLQKESKVEKKIAVPERIKVKKTTTHFIYIKPGEEDEYE